MSPSSAPAVVPSDIKDLALSQGGKRRIEWAFQSMSVLQSVRKHFIKTQPFARIRVAACLPVTPETANLLITMRDGGAKLGLCASTPLSTEDDVAASLVRDYGISVYALQGEGESASHSHLQAVLAQKPNVTMDDGCRLISALHAGPPEAIESLLAGMEETAAGANRLRRMAREASLRYPVVAVNDSQTKQLFENHYGTGQSTIEAVLRSTNVLLAGLQVVVVGYGSRGAGITNRAKGLGASIIVAEVDPIRALKASMEGYRVLSMSEAASLGDVFITATGNRNVLGREHFEKFKNGAIVCNAGRSNVEIDLETLTHISASHRASRDSVEEFILRDGRRIYLLGEGRSLHTSSGNMPGASVLDISYGNQALSAEYLVKNFSSLEKTVYPVPATIDRQIAKIKLESMGVKIDRLTVEQEHFLANWSDGI